MSLAEELLDVSLDVAGEELPTVTLERHPIWSNEELLEVPGHVISADWAPDDELGVRHQGGRIITGVWEFFPQENKQGMGILSIHIHLLQELELWLKAFSRTDVLQRHKDFFILAVLLMAELVAGHSQDNEPLAGVPLLELVHLGVIPGGRTSERRDILNEDDFALQGGEIKCFSC